jgi:hypothetical protein
MTQTPVLTVGELPPLALQQLLERFGLQLCLADADASIPGSYWGEPEAGLTGSTLHVRDDTPVHSALHEASHYICMDDQRQLHLHRDAGGDFHEENAVCYLQIVLADQLPGMGSARMLADMDAWGYTFRLGSASSWFAEDAADACAWLIQRGKLPLRAPL